MWLPKVGEMVKIKEDAEGLDGKTSLRRGTFLVKEIDTLGKDSYVCIYIPKERIHWWINVSSCEVPEDYNPILEKIALMEKRFKKKQTEKKGSYYRIFDETSAF